MPSTQQLVVISGRKMPSDLYSGGMSFLRNISTNCTRAAITRIKASVCRYSMPKGIRTKVWISQVNRVAMMVTNTTALPMPKATPRSLEQPRYGQLPRYWASTILLTKMAEMKSWKISMEDSFTGEDARSGFILNMRGRRAFRVRRYCCAGELALEQAPQAMQPERGFSGSSSPRRRAMWALR